jgi:endonuclease YncB( thermonuclease family)
MSGWEEAPEYGGGDQRRADAVVAGLVAMLLAAIAWATLVPASPAQGDPAELAGVASVNDGDTIEIHGQRIRLSGFDSPERGAICDGVNVYQRAALALSDFVGSRTVHCDVSGQDRYGRDVATCRVGGQDLGEYMTGQGWARDWPRYSGGAYADEEASARLSQSGIWGLDCPADLWGDRNYSR